MSPTSSFSADLGLDSLDTVEVVMATNDELRRRMAIPRVVASVVGIASAGGKLAVRAASVQWRASPDESQFNVCDDLAPR